MTRPPRSPFEEPIKVECVDGEVVILGPAHLHGAFSPEAAQDSAERLAEMARLCREGEADAAPAAEPPEGAEP
jgi:hypothetical protein